MAGLTIFQTYAMWFMIISSVGSMIIGFKHRKKVPEFSLFYLYPLGSFIQVLIYFLIFFNGIIYSDLVTLNILSTNIFVLYESSIIYYFFWNILKIRRAKSKLLLAAILYTVVLFAYWVFERGFFGGTYTYLIESLFILVLCCMYFFEKIKKPIAQNLAYERTFWVVIGLAFYFCSTFPMFLLSRYIYYEAGLIKETEVYAMNFIFYGVMFLIITIAYVCKPKKA